jgi:hypothetical protein
MSEHVCQAAYDRYGRGLASYVTIPHGQRCTASHRELSDKAMLASLSLRPVHCGRRRMVTSLYEEARLIVRDAACSRVWTKVPMPLRFAVAIDDKGHTKICARYDTNQPIAPSQRSEVLVEVH